MVFGTLSWMMLARNCVHSTLHLDVTRTCICQLEISSAPEVFQRKNYEHSERLHRVR